MTFYEFIIYKMLEEPEMKGFLEEVKSRPATREELEMIHAPAYIDLVASTAGKPYFRLDMDTSTCAKSAGGKDNITVVMCEVMQSQ